MRARLQPPQGTPRACSRCGCTDERACSGGCFWMPALINVCSACATQPEYNAYLKREEAAMRRRARAIASRRPKRKTR